MSWTAVASLAFSGLQSYSGHSAAKKQSEDQSRLSQLQIDEACGVLGCTDESACNYDPDAGFNDGSCLDNDCNEQIDEAIKSLSLLGPSKKAKMNLAEDEYKFALGGLSSKTGIAKEDLSKQIDLSIQKSGLANVGQIGEKKSIMWKRIQNSFTEGQEGLMGQLGKKMGGIEEWFEGEKSRLEGIQRRAALQKQAADEQAGAKFLGIF